MTMQPKSKISSIWNDSTAVEGYRSGVSLHSHTSMSEESLMFIHKMFAFIPGLRSVFEHYERKSRSAGFKLDFVSAHWRPPLLPKMAYDLEERQIQKLGLGALVSITDHDTIAAPMLLRAVPSSRHIPVSVEWTVPFGATEFHIGVHNLPSADGAQWMRMFIEYTAQPNEHRLRAMLRELDDMPGVLVVLNHPIWDLHKVGPEVHTRELLRFLDTMGGCIHALELNGLRDARENRVVVQLARETGYLLISGGDRHSLEPNANINLTAAKNFRDFVDEVRVERRSHVLFMQQYAKPWEQRILHSTLDAVTDFPEFIEGWQRWDDRAFHPDRDGQMLPLSQLWEDGRAPLPLRAAIQFVRMGRSRTFSRSFSLAFPGRHDPQAEMELL
jgi:predicted metal-dependent phosphoesterase TrpH